MSDFSTNLKALRKKASLSQDSLAERLNVSRQTVSSWERGKSYPDLDLLVQLCDALRVTPNELLYPPEKARSPVGFALFNARFFRKIALAVFIVGFLAGIPNSWESYSPAPNAVDVRFSLALAIGYWWKPFLLGSGFMGIAKILAALGDPPRDAEA